MAFFMTVEENEHLKGTKIPRTDGEGKEKKKYF